MEKSTQTTTDFKCDACFNEEFVARTTGVCGHRNRSREFPPLVGVVREYFLKSQI